MPQAMRHVRSVYMDHPRTWMLLNSTKDKGAWLFAVYCRIYQVMRDLRHRSKHQRGRENEHEIRIREARRRSAKMSNEAYQWKPVGCSYCGVVIRTQSECSMAYNMGAGEESFCRTCVPLPKNAQEVIDTFKIFLGEGNENDN